MVQSEDGRMISDPQGCLHVGLGWTDLQEVMRSAKAVRYLRSIASSISYSKRSRRRALSESRVSSEPTLHLLD
jgi:hypothetical protein